VKQPIYRIKDNGRKGNDTVERVKGRLDKSNNKKRAKPYFCIDCKNSPTIGYREGGQRMSIEHGDQGVMINARGRRRLVTP
jgi:hypothetical protein